jgi:diguanylate cyclase (GGDEF)-like protein
MRADLTDPRQGSILIVDDNPTNLRLLSKLLAQEGYEVRKALDGSMALKSVRMLLPDLILLDLMMPNLNGYEVCQQLKQDPYTHDVPIIVLSALNASFDKVKAFQSGATDYITKPFQFEEVLARVQHQLQLKTAKAALRQLNGELERRVQQRTQQLEVAHAKLMALALQDQLTGLPNRVSFSERLSAALEKARINPTFQFAVVFLDCDRFKVINDSLGHSKGDLLLIGISHRLRDIAKLYPSVEGIARFGGDEFALLLTDMSDQTLVTEITQAIFQHLSHPFKIADRNIFINASVGIVWGHRDYEKAEYLLRDADTAMYWAKASGKAQYRWFEPSLHSRAITLLQLESDLRLAIERQEFRVFYQPIVNLKNRKISGFEALVRWWHPTQGFITPDHFIPFSEETGLIIDIGTQVLRQACRDLAQWQQQGLVSSDLTISVNLSTQQLLQPNIVNIICQTIEQSGIRPNHLRLELTESAIIDNREFVDSVLRTLRSQNIQLSIDDFGTGYSSLSYLHTLPVNCLKIDRSFVKSINASEESLGIVPLIISIAHTMGMQVIAEGVENELQYQQLKALDCDYGQGYLFDPALDAPHVVKLLQKACTTSVEKTH